MSNEFLGVGWSFPLQDDTTHQVKIAAGEDSIQQAIWLILATAKGERVMRPDFGCGIHDLVFSVNNATTAGVVAREVREALVRWEPRILLHDVQVSTTLDAPSTLLIQIEYQVRATNNFFNLVYPFYLAGGTT
jgi:uncharacterized protein